MNLISKFAEEIAVEGYEFHQSKGCIGEDNLFDDKLKESDIDECKLKCDANKACVSFEYWGETNPHEELGEGVCHLSSTCTLDSKSITGMSCNLYVKNEGNSTLIRL